LREAEKDFANVKLLKHSHNIGRIGNWDFCVRHFLSSGAEWMKWLFAGDVLAADAARQFSAATASTTKEIGLMVMGHTMVLPSGPVPWRGVGPAGVVDPGDAMKLIAREPNVIGAPTGHLVHRRAIEKHYSFGELPFVADMQFCVNIARRHSVLFADGNVGEFRTQARKYFSSNVNTFRSRMEMWCVRMCAADAYREITGDDPGHALLLENIENEVFGTLAESYGERLLPLYQGRRLVRELRRRFPDYARNLLT